MASAKKEAMRYLGNENDYINLTGLNNERDLANQVYNTNTSAYQNAYNDLLNTIASNREKARTDFGSGRSTISENAFLRNRESASDLASRGLNGGLRQLSKVGNRIETGRQYSDLANTYYNTMGNIDATEKTGTNEYNTNMETAKNTLSAALADVDAREKAGRNAYKGAVAQLAEQIQARRDAAAAAAASLALQRKQYAEQVKQAQNDAINKFNQSLISAIDNASSKKEGVNAALRLYREMYGGDKTSADLANWATKYNFLDKLSGATSSKTSSLAGGSSKVTKTTSSSGGKSTAVTKSSKKGG